MSGETAPKMTTGGHAIMVERGYLKESSMGLRSFYHAYIAIWLTSLQPRYQAAKQGQIISLFTKSSKEKK